MVPAAAASGPKVGELSSPSAWGGRSGGGAFRVHGHPSIREFVPAVASSSQNNGREREGEGAPILDFDYWLLILFINSRKLISFHARPRLPHGEIYKPLFLQGRTKPQ